MAARFLEKAGLRVLARNAATRAGELDLVMEDPADGTIVFVEVRGRRSARHGLPEETVGPRKMRTIARVAEAFLVRNKLLGRNVRFDVVAVDTGIDPPAVRHYPNAFTLDRLG